MFTPVLPAQDAPAQARAAAYREQLRAAGEYINGLQAVDHEKRGDDWKADMRSAVDFIHQADPALTALERSAPPAQPGPTGNLHPAHEGFRSFGQMTAERQEYRDAGAQGWSSSKNIELEMRGSLFASNPGQFRAITSDSDTSGGVFLPQAPNPIAPRPRQMRLFLRDVIDVVETGLSNVPYIREVDAAALEFGASAVAEGTAKPEVAMRWELDEAPIRKIAAWVTVTSEVIEDAPTLRGYIDGRLSYLLAVREEYEILNGSGSAPHLKGILQYADLQTQAAGSDDMAGLGLAIGKVENVDGEADAIVMHPLDYWTMITTRQANQFDGAGTIGVGTQGLPFTAGPPSVWGLPVIRSRAITRTEALVGSWSMGATLFDRMSTRIVVGNQHSDYFVNNKIAILAEERVGLAVHRPDFFVKVTGIG